MNEIRIFSHNCRDSNLSTQKFQLHSQKEFCDFIRFNHFPIRRMNKKRNIRYEYELLCNI